MSQRRDDKANLQGPFKGSYDLFVDALNSQKDSMQYEQNERNDVTDQERTHSAISPVPPENKRHSTMA
jgi:hypothetical protein